MTRFTCVSERLSYGISADAHALLGVNTGSVVDGKGLFQFWVMSTWRMAAVRSNCIRRSKVHWFSYDVFRVYKVPLYIHYKDLFLILWQLETQLAAEEFFSPIFRLSLAREGKCGLLGYLVDLFLFGPVK